MQTFLVWAALCVGAFAQFSSSGQQDIINAHNTLRSKIAKGTYVAKGTQKPAGSNIRKMKWDTSVATSAQNYANECRSSHSGVAGLGENIYYYWTSLPVTSLDKIGLKACAAWEKEFQDYGWKSNLLDMNLVKTGIGHATQMAWADSYLVGCGVKSCGKDSKKYGLNRVVVVCQYKPQGNYLTQNIYQSGTTCSACPSGTSCEKSTGLCA
ncbi:unnamed protein product [Caenorhabditis sp. 36 PRJEB53466]|nr:unnamed protein product [Caenorhabditis sp. 36 PRJEB53466]